MKRLLISFFLFVGLGCGLAACGPQPEPDVTPTPEQVEVRKPLILLEDNFDEEKDAHGWNVDEKVEVGKSSVIREKKSLILQAEGNNTFVWSNPSASVLKSPDDVVIEVDASRTSGQQNNLFGVICRYQDEKNFYLLLISSDGHFGIGKVKAGKYSLLNRWDYPPSEDIKKNETNRIKAVCLGETLILSVNGEPLDVQQDADFETGNIGLIVGSLNGMTAVSFDNLIVTGP